MMYNSSPIFFSICWLPLCGCSCSKVIVRTYVFSLFGSCSLSKVLVRVESNIVDLETFSSVYQLLILHIGFYKSKKQSQYMLCVPLFSFNFLDHCFWFLGTSMYRVYIQIEIFIVLFLFNSTGSC